MHERRGGFRGENPGIRPAAFVQCGLNRLHLVVEVGDLQLLGLELVLLFADQRLLFFCGLDQESGQAAVIDAPGVLTILFPGDDFGNHAEPTSSAMTPTSCLPLSFMS